jgi:hypothetical protein
VDALVHLEIFYQLRAKVVAVVVCHQVWQLTVNLVDYLVDERLLGNAEMVLKELAPHLLGRKLDYVTIQYLELLFGIPIGLFYVMLDLLNKFIITLIAVPCETTLVGDPRGTTRLALLLLLFLGARLLSAITPSRVDRFVVRRDHLGAA